jgi:hypothetical protein
MFREIRGIQQRNRAERRRWFQDPFFDLFLTQNFVGRVQWFQLCYRRDTPAERVLEWKRGRGFQHLKVRQPRHAADRESGELLADGVMPYLDVLQWFERASGGLPATLSAFVAEKVQQFGRGGRKYRRKGAMTPRWIGRLHQRKL